jgi:LPXTG-motif cell wall-anchored protein
VFQLDGSIPYYSVRYVPQVHLDGSGEPLRLRGAAFLEVVIRAPTHDEHYRPVLTPTRLRPDFPALREVNAPASFEGQTTAGIGLAHRVGFRVLELANPTRIVIDLAHPQGVDDGGLGAPQGLTVSPNSGPVGSEVIVEGRGCGNLDEPIRLVFQSGASGTVGAVDLGEFEVSEQDAFRATAVVIPANLDPLQGVGGGPTQPGTYQFTTKPPTCTATFTVTGPATNPPDTPGTLPFTGSHTPLLLAIGSGLVVAGTGLVLLVRRKARLAS